MFWNSIYWNTYWNKLYQNEIKRRITESPVAFSTTWPWKPGVKLPFVPKNKWACYICLQQKQVQDSVVLFIGSKLLYHSENSQSLRLDTVETKKVKMKW